MAIQFKHVLPATLLTAALGLGWAQGAQAVLISRPSNQNATGACQSALPVFEGQIRKRPLAVQNEGTGPAFVTCSFMSGADFVERLAVYADNNTGSAINLTCTLVDGFSGSSPAPVYIPKTVYLGPNSKLVAFLWTTSDNGGLFYQRDVNVSCNLPIGVGLTLTVVTYYEDVGA